MTEIMAMGLKLDEEEEKDDMFCEFPLLRREAIVGKSFQSLAKDSKVPGLDTDGLAGTSTDASVEQTVNRLGG